MKYILHSFLLGFIFLFAFCPLANASHAAGAELTYVWKNDSTYTIIYHLYRDCSGIPQPDSVSVCYNNDSNAYQNTVYLKKTTYLGDGRPNGSDILIACPLFPTTCHGGTLPGYQEWWYSGDITLPFRTIWHLAHSESARNNTILNIHPDNLYVETDLDNLDAPHNSSPYFTIKPVPYVGDNIPFIYSNGAIDPDGDSLSYEFITPQTAPYDCGPNYNETYEIGYNLSNNPLACDSTFSFNNATGQMSFTPSATGVYALTVRTSEYRNISGTWIKIGSIMRDIQVVVLVTTGHTPTFSLIDATVYGMTKIGSQYVACARVPLGFCFDAKSVDTDAVLAVKDNSAILGGNVSYTHKFSDSVRGCFSWTPGSLDTGLKTVLISIKDSSCLRSSRLPVSNTYVVPIFVQPSTRIIVDTSDGLDTAAICPYDSVTLVAADGSGFSWTVLSGGAPLSSLSCTACGTTVVRPGVTTTYVVHAIEGTSCIDSDTITLHVRSSLIPAVTLAASPDSFVSSSATTVFTAKPVNGGRKPSFSWYKNGTIISGATSTTYTCYGGLSDKDLISVRLNSSATCAAPDTASASIKLRSDRLVVSKISGLDHSIQLYPNPTGGDFTLTASVTNTANQATIEITDIAGRTVYKEIVAVNNGKISRRISLKNNVLAGQYTLHIQSGATLKSILFTLQK